MDVIEKYEVLYIASYVLPLVSGSKFRVLDLPVCIYKSSGMFYGLIVSQSIISQYMAYIKETFQDARFLQSKPQASSTSLNLRPSLTGNDYRKGQILIKR